MNDLGFFVTALPKQDGMLMTTRRSNFGSRLVRLATVVGSGVMLPAFLDSCDETLINLTRYVDPCGTILANCNPGDFVVNNAEVGDYCVDPTCTLPGGCGDGQALGTITDICP